MNIIHKAPLENIGYGFIPKTYLPQDKTEYHLRFIQNQPAAVYRHLRGDEIEILVHNNNTATNWNEILVTNQFDPRLVKNCQFYGLVRIGKLEPLYLEFHDLKLPVGLYDSTINSCDLGDNVVINNVVNMAHYIIGDSCILVNVQELTTTNAAKFGNGILKQGEPESSRIWLEICNENGGRKVLPFEGMLPADAWIWSKFRDRIPLMEKFKAFTENILDDHRGYYGTIGNYTVIKNCRVIKDVRIGEHAYLKGANKLKNMTIRSTADDPSQIGEGCEMVNGIMDVGCRAFYGIKAVRFVMASHSSLKYGARLINSYLGNNATISCCEVLNSLIYPAHEQHHNTSFLIASTFLGQSNVAAGATIGSNHNSRGPDGELIAGRGFWPGLSVTLKHNSRFASFTLMTKGNYLYEMDQRLPFSLISNNESSNELVIYPGYWFDNNLFALARNAHKFKFRDLRREPRQTLEYEYLAPDSVDEMTEAVIFLKSLVTSDETDLLLNTIENSKRTTRIRKPKRAIVLYKQQIQYYLVKCLLDYQSGNHLPLPKPKAHTWVNLGGQLVTRAQLEKLLSRIESGQINSWEAVHHYYFQCTESYPRLKLEHAMASYLKSHELKKISEWETMLDEALDTNEWVYHQIIKSKQKDFVNPFRKMMYDNGEEMESVLGRMENIPFLKEAEIQHKNFILAVNKLHKKLKKEPF